MANTTAGANAICPYWLKEAKYSITCESTITGAQNMQRFRTEREKAEHEHAYCETFAYARCPYARLLNVHYTQD